MTVQIWNNEDDAFLGRLTYYREITIQLILSEAGQFSASAPYAEWRDIMEITPNFQYVRLYGADGTELMRGIWLTRDDDTGIPGHLEMGGVDLLEELRAPCLPPDFYISHYPIVDAISWLLEQSGTDWEIGDTTLAAVGYVSVNLSGESYLSAILEIAGLSGNYVRHNGIDRSLDVFATPFPVAATILGMLSDDEDLPVATGRIVQAPSLTIDTGEVLRGVYPQGGSIIDEDGNERTLRPKGVEDLPAGFSFSRVGGQVAIVNDAVTKGLWRIAEYSLIEPLSNRAVTASGDIEAGGNNWITCEALRRPNNSFWTGGVLTVADTEYDVVTHSGPTVTGGWGTQPIGAPFSVERVFEHDADAEDDARQDLVDAAVGFLSANGEVAQQLSVTVEGLQGVTIRPGDQVRLEWIATVETQDLITDELTRYILDSFRGDLVVCSVSVSAGAKTQHTLELVKDLQLIPTESGLREIQELSQIAGRYNRVLNAMPVPRMDINADVLRLREAKTPATAAAAGNQGDICWDDDFIYVAVDEDTWKRAALAAW